jgi:SAM-dependent methyltransferase
MSDRCSRVLRAVHRTIESELQRLRQGVARPMRSLDVGCWDGEVTARYGEILGGPMLGIEVFPDQAALARSRDIEVAECDLETQSFPWSDGSVDLVVANQIFEHLKNVWLPMSEIARVVAPGGWLIFSVPNLASLHNRVLLALGRQPSSIRTFGPHVRGYTLRQANEFVSLGGFFDIVRTVGVGFYPLPADLSAPIAQLWPHASHTPVIVARRIAPAGAKPPWLTLHEEARSGSEQTYYAG